MGIFDNFGDKVQDVAKKSGELAQSAAKKSGDLLEVTKLNMKVKDEESKIKTNYEEIGKIEFKKYKEAGLNNIPEELQVFVTNVIKSFGEIEELKIKVEAIKGETNKEGE